MDKETEEKVLDAFATWYSQTIDASARMLPEDWKVAPYKRAFIIVPSGGGYGNYMHILKGENCIGFSPGLTTVESAYQELLGLEAGS